MVAENLRAVSEHLPSNQAGHTKHQRINKENTANSKIISTQNCGMSQTHATRPDSQSHLTHVLHYRAG